MTYIIVLFCLTALKSNEQIRPDVMFITSGSTRKCICLFPKG